MLSIALATSLSLQTPGPARPEISIRELLAVRTAGNRRSLLRADALELQLIRGGWSGANEGDSLGANKWAKAAAGPDGAFTGALFSGGYALARVESPLEEIRILEAAGHGLVYVNGEPRTGDPYGTGYVGVPVLLKRGENQLLFATGRGRLVAKLVAPKAPAFLDLRDATLPDLHPMVKGALEAGLILVNAQSAPGTFTIRAKAGGKTLNSTVEIDALTNRKARVRIPNGSEKVSLEVLQDGKVLDRTELTLRKRERSQPYKRTFVSDIDGSVQYYGVNPSSNNGAGQAMFLSLHGASVEGIGQAEAYAAKSWGHLVAPTNRRPFGFDWEEVGRLDALEVLAHAEKELKTDARRTYLTGHSMGGHGTWQIGVHFPDRFAAIAPSAGWISFWTYAGGGAFDEAKPVEDILRRSTGASDTLALKRNYWQQAVYIVHGDADDNVPVTQARTMIKELEGHPALAWHEEKGAGHWWGGGDEPGARCVDWPGIFDTFARRTIPLGKDLRKLEFSTANPGVSAKNHWVTIQQQVKPWATSKVNLDADPHLGRIRGTTENVARLTLRPDALIKKDKVRIQLDGQAEFTADWSKDGDLHLMRTPKGWAVAGPVPVTEKHPGRSGGFKDIFRNRVVFVYATAGNAAENAWAKSKARYDAEMFWVRGNASVDVMSDAAFLRAKTEGRNVLLYGNADTNRAWSTLLGDSPVQVKRGSVTVDGKALSGDSLGALFIRPRAGSSTACVGVVAGSGLVGSRLLDRSPFFTSGAGIPDLAVLTPDMLEKGSAGIAVAGFFGNDWSVKTGDFAWNQ